MARGTVYSLVLILWLLSLAGCATRLPQPAPARAAATAVPTPRPLRLLFIGNSLTYANDLPRLVQQVATAAGQPPPEVRMVASGGFSLQDHWDDGAAQAALAEGGWDVVILQQGPSALPASQRELRASTVRFADVIRRSGARPALYMVWPERERLYALPDVGLAYAAAAQAGDGLLLPVGDAWQIAWQRDPCLPLYSPDGFHPSPTGSWLAALVIYGGVYGARGIDVTLPAPPDGLGLTAAQSQVLQESATTALVQARSLTLDDRRHQTVSIVPCPPPSPVR